MAKGCFSATQVCIFGCWCPDFVDRGAVRQSLVDPLLRIHPTENVETELVKSPALLFKDDIKGVEPLVLPFYSETSRRFGVKHFESQQPWVNSRAVLKEKTIAAQRSCIEQVWGVRMLH